MNGLANILSSFFALHASFRSIVALAKSAQFFAESMTLSLKKVSLDLRDFLSKSKWKANRS